MFLQYWRVDKFQTKNKRQSPNSPCLDTLSEAGCSHFFSCFPTGSSWRHGCYRRSGCRDSTGKAERGEWALVAVGTVLRGKEGGDIPVPVSLKLSNPGLPLASQSAVPSTVPLIPGIGTLHRLTFLLLSSVCLMTRTGTVHTSNTRKFYLVCCLYPKPSTSVPHCDYRSFLPSCESFSPPFSSSFSSCFFLRNTIAQPEPLASKADSSLSSVPQRKRHLSPAHR